MPMLPPLTSDLGSSFSVVLRLSGVIHSCMSGLGDIDDQDRCVHTYIFTHLHIYLGTTNGSV